MATRKSRSRNGPSAARSARGAGSETANAITESAQKIWLAGLGAFQRAKAEGPRMFDTLVKQGNQLGGQAREAADQALRTLRESASGAGGRFDKLEQVFEDRVSRSLKRLGVITRAEVADLNAGVRELAEQVRQMMAQREKSAGGAARKAAPKAKRKKRARGATRASRARRA